MSAAKGGKGGLSGSRGEAKGWEEGGGRVRDDSHCKSAKLLPYGAY